MVKDNKKNIEQIVGLSAMTVGVIEYGVVEVLIDGYCIEFDVEESSDKDINVLMNNYNPKARKLALKYGAKFVKKGAIGYRKNLLVGGDFADYIFDIYSRTGESHTCNWYVDDYKNIDSKII